MKTRYAVIDMFYWRKDARPPKHVNTWEAAQAAAEMLGNKWQPIEYKRVHRRYGANQTKLVWHMRGAESNKSLLKYLGLED